MVSSGRLAGDQPDHVLRDDLLHVDAIVRRERRALQFDRLEVAALGLLLGGFEVEAGGLEQLDRAVALDPAFQQGVRLARLVADDVEQRGGVRVLHRRPAVGGRRGLMDHQEADRPAARGLFVLVGPAAVIGHRLAAEVALAGLEVGIVDQHEGDLALQVDALEVVPVTLGRGHAIADEDDRGVLDGDLRRAGLGCAQGDVLALGPGLGLAAGGDADADRALDLEAGQRHVLGPGALALHQISTRLQSGVLELVDDVGDRFLLAFGGRAATFELIGRQHLHVLGDLGGVDVAGEGRGGENGPNRGASEQKLFHSSLKWGWNCAEP